MNRAAAPSPSEVLVREVTPKRGTFVFVRVRLPVVIGLLLVVAGATGAAMGEPLALVGAAAAAAVLVGVASWSAFVQHRKERYRFMGDRVIATRGGLFSDQSTELDYRNITQVRVRLPWPRYPLFKVGDVMIESAGSGGSEVVLRCVHRPDQLDVAISALMRRNGFALTRGELLHEERPDLLGVILECMGMAVFATIGAIFFFGEMFADQLIDGGGLPDWLLLVAALMALSGLAYLVLHFLDMRRRTYRVYSDAIVYEEGFLSRNNAFFPAENLADAESRRTFVDVLLGLYDVAVSCQGGGSEVRFRRLRRGKEMADTIDRLVARSAGLAPKPGAGSAGRLQAPGAAIGGRRPAPAAVAAVPPGEAWTGELEPSMARGVLPPLVACVPLFPLIPLWLVAAVGAAIQAAFTQYAVRPRSVRSTYRFLGLREREFTYDKITGLVVHEGPVDRMLGTITVQLWSIGSTEPLTLRHVRRTDLDLDALIRQAGIPPAPPLGAMPARFGLGVWLRAHLVGGLAAATFVAAVGILAVLVSPWFLVVLAPCAVAAVGLVVYGQLRYARMTATLHPQHVEMTDGLLWRDHFYARYANIKKLTLTRYPGGDSGDVRFFVAGEWQRQAQAKRSRGAPAGAAGGLARGTPYGFRLRFCEGIERKKVLLDDVVREPGPQSVARLLEGGPVAPPRATLEDRPALGNSLVALLLGSVLLVPALALLPVTLPLTILSVRRRAGRVEAERVVFTSGILYRQQTSILLDRIDTIRHAQNLLNKMFGNGNVTVLTAGSSSADLVLAHLPGYLALHGAIQERYRQAR